MTIHLLYREKFEPIVRIGEYVGILDGTKVVGIYRVIYNEPIQPKIYNLGPLSTPGAGKYPMPGASYELDDLEPPENELFQLRLRLLDDFIVEVYQPASTSRFNIKTASTPVTVLSPPNFVELYTFKDRKIKLIPANIRFQEMKLARILVLGFRYVLEPVAKSKTEAERKGIKEVTWVVVGAKAPSV